MGQKSVQIAALVKHIYKKKKEGETSNKGGTLDITSDRKKEKQGRVSEENKVGKGTGTI